MGFEWFKDRWCEAPEVHRDDRLVGEGHALAQKVFAA